MDFISFLSWTFSLCFDLIWKRMMYGNKLMRDGLLIDSYMDLQSANTKKSTEISLNETNDL